MVYLLAYLFHAITYQYRIYHEFPFLDQNRNLKTSPKSVQMWALSIHYKLSFPFFNE